VSVLYHYTCPDSAARIVADGVLLKPGAYGLLWLTDMPEPQRLALGLTQHLVRCDRTAFRFTVDGSAEPWTAWAHRHRVPAAVRFELDGAEGALPRAWWVSETPLTAVDVVRTRLGIDVCARASPMSAH
jgi:hypothetical protein